VLRRGGYSPETIKQGPKTKNKIHWPDPNRKKIKIGIIYIK
jgi:hypothetical protein